MSLSDTISSVAASNPAVGLAVARQSNESAILFSLQSGVQGSDSSVSSLLGALSGQAQEVSQLLSSAAPHLGQNVSTSA